MLLNQVVSSHSWEGEGSVVKLPGVDLGDVWESSGLGTNGLGDVHGVGPVSGVESSGEHIDLVVEFIKSLVEVLAWSFELDKGVFLFGAIVIGGAVFSSDGLDGSLSKLSKSVWDSSLGRGNDSQKEECNLGIFHLKKIIRKKFWLTYVVINLIYY